MKTLDEIKRDSAPAAGGCRTYFGQANLQKVRHETWQVLHGDAHHLMLTCKNGTKNCVHPAHMVERDQEVRRLVKELHFPIKEVAERFGITASNVSRILCVTPTGHSQGRPPHAHDLPDHGIVTVKQIAAITGLPASTIRQRIRRGQAGFHLLRKRYAREAPLPVNLDRVEFAPVKEIDQT